MSAMEEAKHVIAQANITLLPDGSIRTSSVQVRINGEVTVAPREQVDFMDVSPKQVVSVAAALIPFLENDDANRALMGSNMQRQAVPLVQADAPLVGTGMEAVVARDSGATDDRSPAGRRRADRRHPHRRARHRGDRPDQPGVDIYRLAKFQRSNQNTCINQRPLVRVGLRSRPATSSPTARRRISASWRSGRTRSSRSCRGTATTSRTRS
jgi:DNA-directed RNA polymerase subunit beta